jgi:hypothetical protein
MSSLQVIKRVAKRVFKEPFISLTIGFYCVICSRMDLIFYVQSVRLNCFFKMLPFAFNLIELYLMKAL